MHCSAGGDQCLWGVLGLQSVLGFCVKWHPPECQDPGENITLHRDDQWFNVVANRCIKFFHKPTSGLRKPGKTFKFSVNTIL